MLRLGATRRAAWTALRAAASRTTPRTAASASRTIAPGSSRIYASPALARYVGLRTFAAAAAGGKIEVPVPEMTESISEGTIGEWLVQVGQAVEEDDVLALIETDKIAVEVRTKHKGVVTEINGAEGDTVEVGKIIAVIDPDAEPTVTVKSDAEGDSEAAESIEAAPAAPTAATDAPTPTPTPPKPVNPVLASGVQGERRVKASRMRMRIAERLKEAQNTAAMLTTFNEVDMSALMDLRAEYKDAFLKKHGAKLGFMSAFCKASSVALQEMPDVNAFLDGGDTVYRPNIDISVAVSTPKGLVVPAIRGCEKMSFADIEKTIVNLGESARKGTLTLEDMQGGTFTISNGGVFGSLLSTPILNMPQSAILGMHKIQKRPVVVDDQIVIRPMMYLALTYDHRLIDGREAVKFLVRIKTLVEDPRRLLLDVM